jgi:alkylation response protein AidB-like acyl-CoA dehydrogenase
MDFDTTSEQQQLRDALRRFVDKEYGFEQRNRIIHSEPGVSDAAWRTLVELGLTALPVPEEQGGFGGSAVDMLAPMQEFGRAMLVEPYFATVFGARFLILAGAHEQALAQVASGDLKLAAALGEKQARHELCDIAVGAQVDGDGYLIDGTKTVVIHGAQADKLIVSARSGGARRDTDGISLFLVAADAGGVTRRDYRTIDGLRAADIMFSKVHVAADALLGKAGAGWEILDAAADYGAALLCAEAIGAIDALNAATLDYLKTRQQFGVPIGKFQVLQHRMAEMFMHAEQARSLAILAAVRVSSPDAQERRSAVSAAKARVGQALKFIGQQAVQLHGSMGVTNELPAAHLFKRLTMIELTLGDTDHHLARFVAQPGFRQAA